jgi:pimeloyl-ACP methyl ester carboxylesterase
MIRLPVEIFRSRSSAPAPDPLLFMAGGPGGSTVARRRSGKGLPFLDDRDYILLEQRGARFAQPALECPAVNALTAEVAAGRLRGGARRAALLEAAAACRVELVAAGADLDAYTSDATADDIEDLRRALRLERWNLYGLSYSTRLMLTVLRKHPEGVRSVVLDSVLPPDVSFDDVSAFNLLRSLHAVFDGCAVDPACGAAYPDLHRHFADLVARADRGPLPLPVDPEDAGGKPVEVRGALVADAFYGALHDPEKISLIPRIVADAAAGRYDELTPLVRDNQGPSSMSWGLRYSVWCAEEFPFHSPERMAAQVSPERGLGGIDENTVFPELCRMWNVAPADQAENTPVSSDVPALVFAGELDPDTPPAWGRRLLATMPNARVVEMRGRSHAAAFNACAAAIVTAFLRDPGAPLQAECALKERGADFARSVR